MSFLRDAAESAEKCLEYFKYLSASSSFRKSFSFKPKLTSLCGVATKPEPTTKQKATTKATCIKKMLRKTPQFYGGRHIRLYNYFYNSFVIFYNLTTLPFFYNFTIFYNYKLVKTYTKSTTKPKPTTVRACVCVRVRVCVRLFSDLFTFNCSFVAVKPQFVSTFVSALVFSATQLNRPNIFSNISNIY